MSYKNTCNKYSSLVQWTILKCVADNNNIKIFLMVKRNRGVILKEFIDELESKRYAGVNISAYYRNSLRFYDKIECEIAEKKKGIFTDLQFSKIVAEISQTADIIHDAVETMERAYDDGHKLSPSEQAEVDSLNSQAKQLSAEYEKIKKRAPRRAMQLFEQEMHLKRLANKRWKRGAVDYAMGLTEGCIIFWHDFSLKVLHHRFDWIIKRVYGNSLFTPKEYNDIVDALKSVMEIHRKCLDELKSIKS